MAKYLYMVLVLGFCLLGSIFAADEPAAAGSDGAGAEDRGSLADEYLDYIQGGGEEGGDEGMDEEGAADEEQQKQNIPDQDMQSSDLLLKHFRDAFKGLSDDVIREKIVKLTKEVIDVNKDGFVDFGELKNWMIEEGEKGAAAEDVKSLGFESMDDNNDGTVTMDEMIKDLLRGNEQLKKKVTEDEQERERLKFKAADVDNDGILSKEEYLRYAMPEYFRSMDDYTLTMARKDYDKDNDGKITKKEFMAAERGEDSVKDDETDEETRFSDYDKNADGVIDDQELRGLALEFGVAGLAEYEALNVFKLADEDDDKTLSEKEILDHYLVFARGALPQDIDDASKKEENKESDEGPQGPEEGDELNETLGEEDSKEGEGSDQGGDEGAEEGGAEEGGADEGDADEGGADEEEDSDDVNQERHGGKDEL